MNPELLYRFACEAKRPRATSRTCGATYEVVIGGETLSLTDERILASILAQIRARGWTHENGTWVCDSCNDRLTLCPVCKMTLFRYGVDDACSARCAERLRVDTIDADADATISALKGALRE